MSSFRRWSSLTASAAFAITLLWFLPTLLPSDYFVSLAARLLATVVLVGSFNILMSYLALTSFGHSALYGVGGYALAILLRHYDVDLLLGLLSSVVAGGLVALIIGPILLRSTGIYFLLLSLALGQVLWGIADSWRSLTGGSDGMLIYATPHIFGIDIADPLGSYRVVACLAVLAIVALAVIVRSSFGVALTGTRESETRMAALGFNVFALRLLAFVISGALAGLAGGMVGTINHFVSPDMMSVRLAVTLVLTVILGGRGRFWGPLVAGAVLFGMQEAISANTQYWPLALGALFIVSVYVLRFRLLQTRSRPFRPPALLRTRGLRS
jgi:branched-chain amino acid transport system permease protein